MTQRRTICSPAGRLLVGCLLLVLLAPICSAQSSSDPSSQVQATTPKPAAWGHPVFFVGAKHASLLKPAATIEVWFPGQRSRKDIIMSFARGFGGYQFTAGIGVDSEEEDLFHIDIRGAITRAADRTWLGVETTPVMFRVGSHFWVRGGVGGAFTIGGMQLSRGRVTGNVGFLFLLNSR